MDNVEKAAEDAPNEYSLLAHLEASRTWLAMFDQAPAYIELLTTSIGINSDECVVECDGIRIRTFQDHLGRWALTGPIWYMAESSIFRYPTLSHQRLSPVAIQPWLNRRRKRLKARGLYLEANVIDMRQEEQKRELKSG